MCRGSGENTGHGLFPTKEILDIAGLSSEATDADGKGGGYENTTLIDMFRSGYLTANEWR